MDLAEELQLLAGDNTGENLHGLIPQAAAFNRRLLPSAAKGWTKIDVIATAIRQINAAKEIDPSFVVVNTNDWWDIALTEGFLWPVSVGRPAEPDHAPRIRTGSRSHHEHRAGHFLVGSGNPVAAEIRDRQEMQVEIRRSTATTSRAIS